MNGTKRWWLSKGVLGAVVAGIATLAGLIWKVEITPAEQLELVENIVALASAATAIVGAIVALIGRLKASKTIAKKPEPPVNSGDQGGMPNNPEKSNA